MQIKIFMSSANSIGERNVLKDFAQGVQSWIDQLSSNQNLLSTTRVGRWSNFDAAPDHTLEFEYGENYRPCDLAVIFGSWKPREKGSHNTRNSVAQNAEKFIVIETPLLNRKTNQENTQWRVGLNGYLNRDAEWPIMTEDDALNKLKEIGVNFPGWNNDPKGSVLIALQLPGDASLRGIDINEWAYSSICTIRSITDRPIVVRSHPLISQRGLLEHGDLACKLLLSGMKDVRFSNGAATPWSQDLAEAWCTVTYSSGLAVDSVLSGVPTIACDPGNFAWGISSHYLEEIESPRMASSREIALWLRFLAGCQWSQDDMRDGTVWNYLYNLLHAR